MAFATKKGAQQWAAHYLTAAENPGEYIDPIRGGQVEIIKRGKVWTFPGGDDWIDEVETLAPAA
ncbi:hypothetical protein [Aeromonas veronii]|uniref:hypothetical protein n=1 Tax=Aeromonas veronii TaxID=654 RepID=UPI000E09BDBA|nr:hypothetical protein [Aeromonas veronii]RDE60904.1 hypothetical protein DV708_16520 [Aeromonas veronii]